MLIDLRDSLGVPRSKEELAKLPYLHRLARRTSCVLLLMLWGMSFMYFPVCTAAPFFYLLLWLGVCKPRPIRQFFDFVNGCWLCMVVVVLDKVFGIHTRSFGYRGRFKKRCLFIMNHASHFDWMFFWGVVYRQGEFTYWKPVTKTMIKYVPLIGHAMQLGTHIFIKRRWEEDKDELTDKLQYLNGLDYPIQLLLFPEGGDITHKSKKRSDDYADREGLPRYEYCLHPRTTGFCHIVEQLKSGGLDAVYDVTIAYPDNIAQTEVEFIKGVMPHEIHFHIRNYEAEDMPSENDQLSAWLQDRWKEKEERLKDFYTHREFVDRVQQTTAGDGDSRDDTTSAGEKSLGNHVTYRKSPEIFNNRSVRSIVWAFFCQSGLSLLCAYLCWYSWVVVVYTLLVTTWVFYVSYFGKGLDYFIMSFARKSTELAKARHMKQRLTENGNGTSGNGTGNETRWNR